MSDMPLWGTITFEVVKLGAQFSGALVVARLAVNWALRRYKSEKIWERQLAAFSDSVSALAHLRKVLHAEIDQFEEQGGSHIDRDLYQKSYFFRWTLPLGFTNLTWSSARQMAILVAIRSMFFIRKWQRLMGCWNFLLNVGAQILADSPKSLPNSEWICDSCLILSHLGQTGFCPGDRQQFHLFAQFRPVAAFTAWPSFTDWIKTAVVSQ
mgnify:CR=1 FL=1